MLRRFYIVEEEFLAGLTAYLSFLDILIHRATTYMCYSAIKPSWLPTFPLGTFRINATKESAWTIIGLEPVLAGRSEFTVLPMSTPSYWQLGMA